MYREDHTKDRSIAPLSRRRFVQGAAAAAALVRHRYAFGATAVPYLPPSLAAKHFDLTVDALPVNLTGRRSVATAVNASLPAPVLRWREGDTVTLAVTNRLKTQTSIHWHGIRLPANMDGVPGLSFSGIAPCETFVYRFPIVQNGTYWYHSHSGYQEQKGLAGAIIIDPRGKDPVEYDREYVVFLSDWSDDNPETIFRNLKLQSSYYNYHRQTVPRFFADVKEKGFRAAASQRLAWARMNMSPSDISDVSGATYTYLLNGNAPNANWTGLFQPGEKVRLRFINGSSMTFFDVRVPGLQMTVVQADGNDVEPVAVDEFRIGVAETYDVIVQPEHRTPYTIFAQSIDRSGYARGTLAPAAGMTAAVPPMDPRPSRTMMDMGMGHMAGMKIAGMDMDMKGMDMATADTTHMHMDSAPAQDASMHRSHAMPGGMEMGSSDGTTPFPQPGPNTMPIMPAGIEAHPEPAPPVQMRIGPDVDNVAMHVTERLNDPGDGLENNGRRVLTYADLRARYRSVDARPPSREIELHLSGNMERYIWGFNGQKFAAAGPIQLKLGERVRFVLINDTMMEHPIHLHGMWSELENGHGAFNPYKQTVVVKPAERLSFLVSADTPGHLAFHCHLLYHMEAGMFRTVVVS